jgi:hypothetical protein
MFIQGKQHTPNIFSERNHLTETRHRRHEKKTPLVAQRLLLLQEMFEGTRRGASLRMAQRLGITPTVWSNVLTASPLSIRLAQRIVLTFPGVSLDWLYLGRPEGLRCQIAEKLGYGATRPSDAEQKNSQEQIRPLTIQSLQIGPGTEAGVATDKAH